MKTPLLLFLSLAALTPAQAEIFRPALRRDAAWGPRTDVVVGYQHRHGGHRYSGYYGGSGVYLGATYGRARYHSPYLAHRGYAPWRPYYAHPRHIGYSYSVPVVYSNSAYYDYDPGYSDERPSRAASGLWLGALAGAIIGNNSGSLGHDAWRGALYGAGTGLVIGAVADNRARQREAAAERAASAQRAMNEAPLATAQPTTIINNYYNTPAATPMSSANSLFGRN